MRTKIKRRSLLSSPIYAGRADCKLPRINRKMGATVVGGRARLFTTKEHKQTMEQLAWAFRSSWKGAPIDHYVDAHITIAMSKRTDTDAPVKSILDALEDAGVVENDKRVRDLVVRREYQSDEFVEVVLWHTSEGIAR